MGKNLLISPLMRPYSAGEMFPHLIFPFPPPSNQSRTQGTQVSLRQHQHRCVTRTQMGCPDPEKEVKNDEHRHDDRENDYSFNIWVHFDE